MNRFSMRLLWLGLLTALAAPAAQAGNWWNSEWTARKKITTDTTAAGVPIPETISAAPVLVRLHAGNFQFEGAREDGSDLRFVAEDHATVLPHHVEKYDALMGEAFVWVKVSELTPKAPVSFWLYHGNRNPQMPRGDDAKGTYDADTAAVYHFSEIGSAPQDMTGNGNHGQNAGLPAGGAYIGTGLRLDNNTAVAIPPSPSLQWTEGGPATIAAWVKLTVAPSTGWIVSRVDATNSVVVGADNGVPYVEIARGSSIQRVAASAALPVGAWRHLAVVAGPAGMTLFVDGEEAGRGAGALPAMSAGLQLGGEGFQGELDELQIARVARPPGYIRLLAVSQGEKGSKLLALGPDEQTGSWFSAGYLGIIVKSLTVDGWIAIVILMIMMAISWWVMIGKAAYLQGVTKGNDAFMKLWHHVADDLKMLGNADEEHAKTLGGRIDAKSFKVIRRSPIYRLYDIGLDELRDRVKADQRRRATHTLSAQSVQAIRSMLDGGLVRETQKLNAQMVLLTIAISGGPFVGLLGTVAGVMITFAGVAQEGEVNVPGIAPGISAALLATVAGLAVAIPALFGYNYLLTRVKNAQSDMHVFIDEFVTKLAECYSGSNGEKHFPTIVPTEMLAAEESPLGEPVAQE